MNLINNISIFHSLGFPILVGNSRKKFIKEISGKNDTKKEQEELLLHLLFDDARSSNFKNS